MLMDRFVSRRAFFGAVVAFGLVFVAMAQDGVREPGPFPPAQTLKNPFEFGEASARAGKRVYDRYCITCHASDGKGSKDMETELPIALPDFTDGQWKYGKTDGEIFTIVRDGTSLGMEPFKSSIDERSMWHIVNYLRSLGPKSDVAIAPDAVPENPVAANVDSVRRGRYLYDNYCSLCHGDDGSGYTDYLDFLSTAPADFREGKYRYGQRDGDLFNVIKNGTENDMESFKDRLKDDQIWDTINYLKRFAR